MASFKNVSAILIELSKNLSWPLSRSRTHAFVASIVILAIFFYLSVTIADNSPAATAATLAARFVFTSISSFTSVSPPSFHPVLDAPENHTNGTAISAAAVAAVQTAHRNSRETDNTGNAGDLAACDIFNGKWIAEKSRPAYQPGSCPYIDDAFNCFSNGRPDTDYLRFRWQPNECRIPKFNGKTMLKLLTGKRLVFVGDSLNRNMWQSLVCALRDSVPDKNRVFEISGRHEFRTQGFYSFRFKDYNCSVEFVRAPFLVQESKNSDTKGGTRKETLRLDLIQGSNSKYQEADIIIFNTGHWWTHHKTSRGQNYYQEGNHVYSKLAVTEAFTKALRTWAQWIDTNVNSNRTRVFFRGYSASHFRGGQWNSGGNCDGETEPITDDKYLDPYPWMMSILESVMSEMKTPVFYLNITRMTDYRKDAHPSIYRMPANQRRPGTSQDCSHWCLPGVPDTWNELLYATLLISSHYASLPNGH